MTACVRQHSGRAEEEEQEEPPKRFPVLQLPHLVINEFIRLLGASDLLNFSFTSKRSHEICKFFTWKYPLSYMEYRYPTQLRLFFDESPPISYFFYHTSEMKPTDIFMKQNICEHSYLTKYHRRNEENQENYIVYSENPVRVIFLWALYFRDLYGFKQSRLHVIIGNRSDQLKKFFERFIELNARKTSQLYLEVSLETEDDIRHQSERIYMTHAAVSDIIVLSKITYKLGCLSIYKAFNSTQVNLQEALEKKSLYVDLRDSTITDEEMNEMINKWKQDVDVENVDFLTFSIQRNYDRKQIDYDLLLAGLEYNRLEENDSRVVDRLNDDLFAERYNALGGFDVPRDDGAVLSIHIEYDRQIHGVVYFSLPNPDWHTIHFVYSWPEE